ncbi:nucleotide exchange factor GrpE [Lignipirellula cremea]|uniref:Protein GrpE n=1 Tax=Lignipirellula cremea TaxID=2528010 RepID=A0A518DY03_9BACT|nr:nucleotide exchange factor GrpE [Lignipirellula cremea]QDU96675.1 heat shock protein GrpE [Lignipirellula cremea]
MSQTPPSSDRPESSSPEQSAGAANDPQSAAAQQAPQDAGEDRQSPDTAGSPLSREEHSSQLQAELEEEKNRVLMVQAELENFRKRSRRELDDQRRYAAVPVVSDLLAVLDNLNRAIGSAPDDPKAKGLVDGVKMVASMFESVFEKHHCRRIASVGEVFDPNLHEAIGQQPSDQYPAGTVMLETQVGYQLHDRVIRPAQVFVSTGPA